MLEEPTETQLKACYKDAVAPLSSGLLKAYQPDLLQVKKALHELNEKEQMLQNQIHTENLALAEAQHSDELNTMFKDIEVYVGKLANIRKDMRSLHERSVKLKKRSLKLQQLREKEEYLKQQKETELKKEQALIGKPS